MCTSTTLVITEDYPKDYDILECGNPYEPVWTSWVFLPKVDTAAAMQRFQETVRWVAVSGVAVWAYSKSLNLGLGILVHNLSRFMTPELTPPAGIGSMTMIEVSRSRLGSNICFFFLSRLGVKNKGTHKLLNHDFLEKVRNLEVRSWSVWLVWCQLKFRSRLVKELGRWL